MAKEMSFAARWGSACGTAFDAEKFLAAHPQFDWMQKSEEPAIAAVDGVYCGGTGIGRVTMLLIGFPVGGIDWGYE